MTEPTPEEWPPGFTCEELDEPTDLSLKFLLSREGVVIGGASTQAEALVSAWAWYRTTRECELEQERDSAKRALAIYRESEEQQRPLHEAMTEVATLDLERQLAEMSQELADVKLSLKDAERRLYRP